MTLAHDTRRTGMTTRQMRDAPLNATYIWCTPELGYANRLARHLGRPDLQIYAPALLDRPLRGHAEAVLDHAALRTTNRHMTRLRRDHWLEWLEQRMARARQG